MASAAIGQVHRNIEFIRVLTFVQQTMEGLSELIELLKMQFDKDTTLYERSQTYLSTHFPRQRINL